MVLVTRNRLLIGGMAMAAMIVTATFMLTSSPAPLNPQAQYVLGPRTHGT